MQFKRSLALLSCNQTDIKAIREEGRAVGFKGSKKKKKKKSLFSTFFSF